MPDYFSTSFSIFLASTLLFYQLLSFLLSLHPCFLLTLCGPLAVYSWLAVFKIAAKSLGKISWQLSNSWPHRTLLFAMNSIASYHHPRSECSSAPYCHPDDLNRMISSAKSILDQAPPPTLREILGAYRSKGDGDRDMLLAMLNAKTAEDQRLASMASLHRSVLEVYQHAPDHAEPLPRHINGSHDHYSSYTQSSRPCEQRPRRVQQSRSSPSPHRPLSHLPPIDSRSHHSDYPRKRHRSSQSPHSSRAAVYEASHSSEQFPPSPYSSSDRSDSAEYSPRTRASMAIGSLLSSGPRREMNGDTSQERD